MTESSTPPDLKEQRVDLEIIGDDKMNWRLRNMYEYGSFPSWYDPTVMNLKGRDDQAKQVQVNDTLHYVIVTEHKQDAMDTYLFNLKAMTPPVIILTYDVSSKESLQNVKKMYDMIPAPEDGKLRLEPGYPFPRPYHHLFVLAKRYPVVIIGCRYPQENPREVEREDVEMFISQHPDCKFAGECMPKEGANENVDKVFQFVLEVYHELRKQARREEDLYLEVDAKPPKKKRKSCLVL
ncbi:hypothetical protein DL95DRAFT_416923 [Leptodontidium sp. 2 PMI_412]|nr:hypothetical protein DL95DRAFT_416923 [Leptodontidium sp. 2 PMI_412]